MTSETEWLTGASGQGEEDLMSGEGTVVGCHEGVVGALSGDNNVMGEPDGETRGDEGVGWIAEVISIYPHLPSHYLPPCLFLGKEKSQPFGVGCLLFSSSFENILIIP